MSVLKEAIVIDNGSFKIKAGFSGFPFPLDDPYTVIGEPVSKYSDNPFIIQKDYYCGNEVLDKYYRLFLKYPLVNGTIEDEENMERMWDSIFITLKTEPHEISCLLTSSCSSNEKFMMTSMFEHFNCPELMLAGRTVLSLFAFGKESGIVVQCGDNITQISPIVNGQTQKQESIKSNNAGNAISEYLLRTIPKCSKLSSCAPISKRIAREIKEQCCYVSGYFDLDKKAPDDRAFYELPDGQIFKVLKERFQGPEILFNDSNEDIVNLTLKSIRNSEKSIQNMLLENIILSGGTIKLNGFRSRFYSEISNKAETAKIFSSYPKIFSSQEYSDQLSFNGGSILASLSGQDKSWITKREYEEFGFQVIYRKQQHF